MLPTVDLMIFSQNFPTENKNVSNLGRIGKKMLRLTCPGFVPPLPQKFSTKIERRWPILCPWD